MWYGLGGLATAAWKKGGLLIRGAAVCRDAARLTHIADREADIFALFARCPQGSDLLVRAAHDRALEDGGRLFARIDALAVAKAGSTSRPQSMAPPSGPNTTMCESGRATGRGRDLRRQAWEGEGSALAVR